MLEKPERHPGGDVSEPAGTVAHGRLHGRPSGWTVFKDDARDAELRGPSPGQAGVPGKRAPLGGGRPDSQVTLTTVFDVALQIQPPRPVGWIDPRLADQTALRGYSAAVPVPPLEMLLVLLVPAPRQMADLAMVLQVDVPAVPHELRPTPQVPLSDHRPGVGETKMPAMITGLVIRDSHSAKGLYRVEVGSWRKLARERRVEDVLEEQAILKTADQPVRPCLEVPPVCHACLRPPPSAGSAPCSSFRSAL